MKVTYDPVKKKPMREFPYLAASAYNIVLFTKECTGTVVAILNPNASYALGYWTDTWAMECFRPYDGLVTLIND